MPPTATREPGSRRLRRGLAVLTATALATVSLPLAAAYAAPAASAALTQGAETTPGAAREFAVTVTNTRATLGLLGGETINYVDIKLPNTAGIKTLPSVTAPSGWTVRQTSVGGLQTYTFRAGSIAPGSSLAFPFPASVTAPSGDRSGTFEVAVSSDNGQTTAGAAGPLTTLVRTLEIVPGTLAPTGPAGVVDRTGTAGQAIDYAFSVRNLASAPQTVTPSLTSDGGDAVSAPPAASIPAGGTTSFPFSVRLADGGNRTAVLTASGESTGSTARTAQDTFTVQAPASLVLEPGSFAPRAVKPGTATTFSVNAVKTNAPALDIEMAELALPGGVAAAAAPFTAPDGASRTLTFGPAAPTGPDGVYDVAFSFSGQDGNGHAYAQTVSLQDALTLDALAPVIDPFTVGLPSDADGRQQTAVSNSADTITVNGRLSDCSPASLAVVLQPNKGEEIAVPVTRTGCDFSGSVTTGEAGTTFASDATSFVAVASASDAAGNTGSAASPPVTVDLGLPQLVQAQTLSSDANPNRADRILVTFADATTVFGGCAESQYRVDGELLVRDVLYSDGSPCVAGGAGPDASRLLVLLEPRDQDLQTNVTYSPGTRPAADRIVDSAGQDALAATVETISGVVPAAPQIIAVTRPAGGTATEPATMDEGAYWTNSPSGLAVEFSGGRPNYLVEVVDGSGAVLAQRDASVSPSVVDVPLGTADGRYDRALQLVKVVDGRRLVSARTALAVVLDRTAPTLQAVTAVDPRTVDVAFSEPLATGTNFAEDWFVYESNPGQDPADPDDDRAYYLVSTVSGNGATRTLTTNRDRELGGTVGADYLQRSPDGVRYEDRAGNALMDTV